MIVIDTVKMVDEAFSIRGFARQKAPILRAEKIVSLTDKQLEDVIHNLIKAKHKYYTDSDRARVMRWLKNNGYVKVIEESA